MNIKLLLILLLSSCNFQHNQEGSAYKELIMHLKVLEEYSSITYNKSFEYGNNSEIGYSLCIMESASGISSEIGINYTGLIIVSPKDIEKWRAWIEKNKKNLPNIQHLKKRCEGYKL